jgi:cytochrome P450
MDLIETLYHNNALVKENPLNDSNSIGYKQLLNEFCTFFVGGMDTTGHLIANCLILMTYVNK